MEKETKVTPEILRRILRYERDTGKLFWLPRPREMFTTNRSFGIWNTRYAGKEAFTAVGAYGYLCGGIFNYTFMAHRVIWAMETQAWPEVQIDHINGDRSDNRFCNLRSVTRSENQRNMKMPKSNTSGACGVYWQKKEKKWVARIRVDGKQRHLGFFSDFREAAAARKEAERKNGFHENHGRAA